MQNKAGKITFTAIMPQIFVCFWALPQDSNGEALDAPPYPLDDYGGRPSPNPSQLGTFGTLISQKHLRHLHATPHFLNCDYAYAYVQSSLDRNLNTCTLHLI